MKHVLISSVLLLCFYNQLIAQDEDFLKVKIKDAVTSYDTAWKLNDESSVTYDNECNCTSMYLDWIHEGGRLIQAFVYTYKSDAEAHSKFKALKKEYGLNGDKDVKSFEFIEADEIVLLEGQHNGIKVTNLFLRRGRRTVAIFGIGAEYGISKRFASIIALNLPAT